MAGNAQQEGPVGYWQADPRLAGCVSGYHRFSVAMPAGAEHHDILFPSWGVVRIALPGSEPWSIRRGPRSFDPMPQMVLEGPSSYPGYTRASRGTVVGFGIMPSGWARLFGGEASLHANRVTPLETIVPDAAALREALGAAPSPAPVFDAWLLDRLARGPEPDPVVGRIFAMIEDPAITRIETICETLALAPRTLNAIAKTHFGFTPKLLIRRGRFLRALSAALSSEDAWADTIEAAGYWDRSHFLRDSRQFLGCSIREFLARRGVLNTMALKIRADVLGTAV